MFLILLFLNLICASEISDQKFDQHIKTGKINIYWNKAVTSRKEVDDFVKYAGSVYSKVLVFLSNKKNSDNEIG